MGRDIGWGEKEGRERKRDSLRLQIQTVGKSGERRRTAKEEGERRRRGSTRTGRGRNRRETQAEGNRRSSRLRRGKKGPHEAEFCII